MHHSTCQRLWTFNIARDTEASYGGLNRDWKQQEGRREGGKEEEEEEGRRSGPTWGRVYGVYSVQCTLYTVPKIYIYIYTHAVDLLNFRPFIAWLGQNTLTDVLNLAASKKKRASSGLIIGSPSFCPTAELQYVKAERMGQ